MDGIYFNRTRLHVYGGRRTTEHVVKSRPFRLASSNYADSTVVESSMRLDPKPEAADRRDLDAGVASY
jgi:hypothetical protein